MNIKKRIEALEKFLNIKYIKDGEYYTREITYNIGLIVVSTGDYFKYFNRFWNTFKKNFCGGRARLYVFTDKDDKELPNDERLVSIRVKHFGFPMMPLLRWHLILDNKEKYKEDYLYAIDGDVYFNDRITFGELKTKLAGTLHRNIERKRKEFNYETRKESTAYIADNEGEKYFACGFVGGEKGEFLKMAEALKTNIQKDIENGIRAVWGDESHLNRYFVDNPPSKILTPEYMCPENNTKFAKKIVHIYKDFKEVNLEDAKKLTEINPDDFKNLNFYYDKHISI